MQMQCHEAWIVLNTRLGFVGFSGGGVWGANVLRRAFQVSGNEGKAGNASQIGKAREIVVDAKVWGMENVQYNLQFISPDFQAWSIVLLAVMFKP